MQDLLERRLPGLEARVAEIEGGYAETLYRIRRDQIRTTLGVAQILAHLGLPQVSDSAIDEVLESE